MISIYTIGLISSLLLGYNVGMYFSHFISLLMNIKFYKTISSNDLYTDKCIYLTNHKSFGDIICDTLLCDYPIGIARYMVALPFFPQFIGSFITGDFIFFYKTNNLIEKFNNIMNYHFNNYDYNNRNIFYFFHT